MLIYHLRVRWRGWSEQTSPQSLFKYTLIVTLCLQFKLPLWSSRLPPSLAFNKSTAFVVLKLSKILILFQGHYLDDLNLYSISTLCSARKGNPFKQQLIDTTVSSALLEWYQRRGHYHWPTHTRAHPRTHTHAHTRTQKTYVTPFTYLYLDCIEDPFPFHTYSL